eukprot:1149134-Pelagomonas_calceolata.AAC.3
MLAGEDQSQADQPNTLAERSPVTRRALEKITLDCYHQDQGLRGASALSTLFSLIGVGRVFTACEATTAKAKNDTLKLLVEVMKTQEVLLWHILVV